MPSLLGLETEANLAIGDIEITSSWAQVARFHAVGFNFVALARGELLQGYPVFHGPGGAGQRAKSGTLVVPPAVIDILMDRRVTLHHRNPLLQ
ncbi:hypothetical protein D3C80_1936140 [compost metagenome]